MPEGDRTNCPASTAGARRVEQLSRRRLVCFTALAIAAVVCCPAVAIASAVTVPIEQLYAALPQIMKAGKATAFRQRYDTLSPVIDRTFDLDTVLRSSVGPQWTALPASLQTALKEAFRRYTVVTWVANFDSFTGQRFQIEPNTTTAGADQIVQTKIAPASGEPHRLDYVMRQFGGGWKAIDVLADGSISRVAAQRSEIRAVMTAGGGPALLGRLQKKTVEMSGGQVQ